MDILKFLARQIKPVTSSEVAKALSLPISTVMCHLVTLEDGGFVERTEESFTIGIYMAVMWVSVRTSRENTIKKAQKDLDLITMEEKGL